LIPGLLIDALFPSRCAGCGRTVRSREHHLCRSCFEKIPFLSDCCPVCSGPLTGGNCPACAERYWYIKKNLSIAEYGGVIKDIMHGLKFSRIRDLHAVCGSIALKKLAQSGIRADFITWVPMNGKKKWERGFNQSELIARYIAQKTGMPCRGLLRERRTSRIQKALGLRDRFINTLERYVAIEAKDLPGRSVLLVDDIYTTGATINECARQLKTSGAGDIFSLTIARTDIKRLEKI
jgi:competence protein ComFC